MKSNLNINDETVKRQIIGMYCIFTLSGTRMLLQDKREKKGD